MILLALFLLLVWILLTGDFSLASLALGAAISLVLAAWTPGRSRIPRMRLRYLPRLLSAFLIELVRGSMRVSRVVLARRVDPQATIIDVPLALRSRTGIANLAMLVALTPGTLPLDVCSRRRVMTVHAFPAPDPDQARRDIQETLEQHVRRVFP